LGIALGLLSLDLLFFGLNHWSSLLLLLFDLGARFTWRWSLGSLGLLFFFGLASSLFFLFLLLLLLFFLLLF
jgi:hypothetical protein